MLVVAVALAVVGVVAMHGLKGWQPRAFDQYGTAGFAGTNAALRTLIG